MEPLKPLKTFLFVDGARLRAELCRPERPEGLVVLAQGDAAAPSGRDERTIAHALHATGFATLLCDLWTAAERATANVPFALAESAHRLQIVSNWAETHEGLRGLPLGYFGTGRGAAAALRAASEGFSRVKAIVSRDGRLDLVSRDTLTRVHPPTLLIVADDEPEVVAINRDAADHLRCAHRIAVTRGAGSQQNAALERVASHAHRWFQRHLLRHVYRPPIAEEVSVE